MRIALIVEGKTETAFLPYLRTFLEHRLAGNMPILDPVPYNGRVPTGDKLKRLVILLLQEKRKPADCVIALTDVYTGSNPPDFSDAADAKKKMRQWVGPEPRFHPRAAQYDFEAWLLPYWSTIQRLAGHNRAVPSDKPETVNHNKPPAFHIQEIFRIGSCRDDCVKTRDAARILRENDLTTAVTKCPELKALINSILACCEAPTIT